MTTRTPLLLALSLLLGCPSAEPEPDPTPADPCADSMEQGAVRVFASGLTGGTEGITFSPDGRLFVSRGDAIEEVFPDGSHETLAMIPEQVGLAFWNDELIVASGDAGNGDGLGGIFAVDIDDGSFRRIAFGLSSPNFPAVTPWGSLLVSTPSGPETISEITASGDISIWTDAVPAPNGIGFAADGSAAYVVTTYGNPAPLWEIPIANQAAGAPTEVASWGTGVAPDGVAMGASGAVFIAQNLAGRIDRVDPATGEETAIGEGVAYAASAAFGVGADWDRCAVYVTSLATPDLYVVGAGEAGQ